MVTHHLAQFGGHKYRDRRDVTFLVVEEQDSRFSLFTVTFYHSNSHSMSCSHIQNFRQCYKKTKQFVGIFNEGCLVLVRHVHSSNEGNTHIKRFPICPETLRSKTRKKEARKTISKLFKLTNVKIIYGSSFYFEHILKETTFLDKVLNIIS